MPYLMSTYYFQEECCKAKKRGKLWFSIWDRCYQTFSKWHEFPCLSHSPELIWSRVLLQCFSQGIICLICHVSSKTADFPNAIGKLEVWHKNWSSEISSSVQFKKYTEKVIASKYNLTGVLIQQLEWPEGTIAKTTEVMTVFDSPLKQIKGLPNVSPAWLATV